MAGRSHMTQQLGRFTVDWRLFDGMEVSEAAQLFTGMIVLDIRREWNSDARFYFAAHEQFRVLSPNCIVPEYEAILTAGSLVPTLREKVR